MTWQPIERVMCWLGRHRLFIIGRCGVATHHVGCKRCSRRWGMNHDVRAFLPWHEVADFHRETYGYQSEPPVSSLGGR